MQIAKNEITEKWRPKRWWIALIIFWLVSTTGAGIIDRAEGNDELGSGFIILIMLLFAIFAAITDKGWNIYKRIIWVPGVWILHIFLTIPASLITFFIPPPPYLADRSAYLIAAIPLVICSMRRSKFFIKQDIKKNNNG